jgi:hypothetical protein
MAAGDVELLRRAWEVRWYGAGEGEEPDGCHNRDEAVAFIRLALADGVTAELLDIRDAGDRVVLIFQRHQPPDWGERPEPHGELVTVRDGKVVEMVVYPTVDEALAAAGPRGPADARA